MIGSQFIHLLASHPTEAEHTDLVGDVLPRKGRTALLRGFLRKSVRILMMRSAISFTSSYPLRLERGIRRETWTR